MQPSLFPFPAHQGITEISRVAYMQDLGSHVRIVVNHHHLFEYKKGDKISEVAAIVTLLKSGAAKQTDVSRAFNLSRNTPRRYLRNVEKYGSAALFMNKTGPTGPHKITHRVHRYIAEQLHQGKGVGYILKAVKAEFDLGLSRRSIENIRKSLPQQVVRNLVPSAEEGGSASGCEEQLTLLEEQTEGVEETSEEVDGKPLLARDAISSGDTLELAAPKQAPAGLFLLWSFLSRLGFKGIVNDIFSPIRGQLFFVQETLLTIFVLAFLRCRSIEDYKLLEKRQIGLLWEGRRGMDLRTIRRKLGALSHQKKALALLTGLAQRYQEIGLLQLGVLYFDGHFIPYYGDKNIHKGFFTLRRLVVPGQEQFFLNDLNGRPIFFWLEPGNETLLSMLPGIIKQIKKLTNQQSFTIVFDRGGFSSRLFGKLDKLVDIKFITYLRGCREHVHPSAFAEYTIEYRRRKEQAELTELGYIGIRPQHYRVVVRKKSQKQTFILTNDWQRPLDQIATLMFNRWSQENFFKYMVREYHLDAISSYLSEEIPEEIIVTNPARAKNRQNKRQLEQELRQLEQFLVQKTVATRKRALSRKMAQKIQLAQQRVSEIKKMIKQLNAQHRHMPKKVPASQLGDNRSRQILCQEKKILVDSLKMMAYNAEEWLLDILAQKYNNCRDFRRILLLILKQSGTVQRIDNQIVIRLDSLHSPQYQRAAVYLCQEINRMKILAPGGRGTMYFDVEKAG